MSLSSLDFEISFDDTLDESFVEKHGRKVNQISDTYVFAADENEDNRIDFEHRIFKLAMGGLWIGPVVELLDEESDSRRTIADLGTGTGVWAMEVARLFPDVDVLGIDLVPIQRQVVPPDNFYFEQDDLNLSLDHYHGLVDFAHCRMISTGIRNCETFIERLAGIVKPGGLLQLMETDFRLYYAKRDGAWFDVKPRNHPQHYWFVDWQGMLLTALGNIGAECEAGERNREWVAESRSWHEVAYRDVWLPTGNFLPPTKPENILENKLGEMLLADMDDYLKNARPLLLDHFPADQVEEVETRGVAEMKSLDRPQTWIRTTVVCARRLMLARDLQCSEILADYRHSD